MPGGHVNPHQNLPSTAVAEGAAETGVCNNDLPALRHFTDGLTSDYDAIVAGLTLPDSNDPTEGVVNEI